MPNASGNIFYFFGIKMDGCEHDLDSCHYFPDGRVIGNKIFLYCYHVSPDGCYDRDLQRFLSVCDS